MLYIRLDQWLSKSDLKVLIIEASMMSGGNALHIYTILEAKKLALTL